MPINYEKLGVFYLGRRWDANADAVTDGPLLYDSRDLTTHAVCVGMTGSGKTGLGVALLEEAAIDGIPALIIDPKGDMANLALAFPRLLPADFQPWVDPAEAARQGLSTEAFAATTAQQWLQGLAQWNQPPERIAALRAAAAVAIYTPGSEAGRPLGVLRSFDPPDPAVQADAGALRERINATVSGLLGLLGINADPLRSREHILLAALFAAVWRDGRSLDLPALITAIQRPPFQQVGVFDLDTFFPAAERLALAMTINNLLAAPGFAIWLQGEPLDIQRLLFTPEGKPQLAVLSIAHLSDSERMFFVTLLLNEVVAWMRRQSGTSSLRALLYMDEIFGYFPPTATPPSKQPMLTLLKQARAYGLGVVLATQNPVDLDYKGLANAGTWFIGRLQTERDRMRVLDGLESVLAGAAGSLERPQLDQLLAKLGNRVFLMRNVHDNESVLFQTRWTLSFLRGPMTASQLRALKPGAAAAAATAPVAAASGTLLSSPSGLSAASASRPPLPSAVAERFLATEHPDGRPLTLQPRLLGTVKLHFVDATTDTDHWVTRSYITLLPESGAPSPWDTAETQEDIEARLATAPPAAARFAPLPPAAARDRNYAIWRQALVAHVYQTQTLELLTCPALKLSARVGATIGDFKAEIALAMRERRDAEVERLRLRYAARLTTVGDQVRRAADRLAREKDQLGQRRMQTAVSVGSAIFGALLGRRAMSVGSVGRASTAMRSAGRIGSEAADVGRAEESLDVLQQRQAALESELAQEVAALQARFDPANAAIDTVRLRPRKSDIMAGEITLLWMSCAHE